MKANLQVSLVSDGSGSIPSSASHQLGGILVPLELLKINKYMKMANTLLITQHRIHCQLCSFFSLFLYAARGIHDLFIRSEGHLSPRRSETMIPSPASRSSDLVFCIFQSNLQPMVTPPHLVYAFLCLITRPLYLSRVGKGSHRVRQAPTLLASKAHVLGRMVIPG